jgi:hypothetical protein
MVMMVICHCPFVVFSVAAVELKRGAQSAARHARMIFDILHTYWSHFHKAHLHTSAHLNGDDIHDHQPTTCWQHGFPHCKWAHNKSSDMWAHQENL